MNPIVEFRSGKNKESLKVLLEKNLKDSFSFSDLSVYIGEKKVRDDKFILRPQSKVTVVQKKVERLHLSIVYEDKELIVIDKPYGLPTQGTLKKQEANLYDYVRYHYYLEKRSPQGFPYVGLHHRLDRDTSGLVLMTKQRSANKEASDLFKLRKIHKTYYAYVEAGDKSPQKQWIYRCHIERSFSKRHPFIFKVSDKGDEAITEFKLLETIEDKYHLIECKPLTGRTHQLRVQLSHLGWPILGDRVYGRKKTAPRLMLHAAKLNFVWKGKDMNIESPLKKDELSQDLL